MQQHVLWTPRHAWLARANTPDKVPIQTAWTIELFRIIRTRNWALLIIVQKKQFVFPGKNTKLFLKFNIHGTLQVNTALKPATGWSTWRTNLQHSAANAICSLYPYLYLEFKSMEEPWRFWLNMKQHASGSWPLAQTFQLLHFTSVHNQIISSTDLCRPILHTWCFYVVLCFYVTLYDCKVKSSFSPYFLSWNVFRVKGESLHLNAVARSKKNLTTLEVLNTPHWFY